MKRLDYFLAAMAAGLYRKRDWVVTAFAVTQEGPDEYKKDPYPYRIVQTRSGTFYVNPENTSEILPLEEVAPNMPPFAKQDKVTLPAGALPNLDREVTTSYGNILANCVLLVYPFGGKLPYVEGRMKPGKLESMIEPLLADDPMSEPEKAAILEKKPNTIFVYEFLKFANAMTYISSFANLWVSGGTRKALLPPPDVEALRDALFQKYGIDPANPNTDPTKVAQVVKELVAHDAKFLEGDDTMNFLLAKKNFEVIRAKKYLMVGAEAGLGDGQSVELVPKSLHEGWDIDRLPAMVNNLRAGSFNRGAETMKGGEAVKWLLRASSNVNILPTDCGSEMGTEVVLDEVNAKRYLNFHAVSGKPGVPAVKLDESTIGQYLGKTLTIRSMMYCKLSMTDYCAVCAGPRLAENPTGASSAISQLGSTMMLMFMKAVHGKALILQKYDYKARIS